MAGAIIGIGKTLLIGLGLKTAWDGANSATDGRAAELAQKGIHNVAGAVERVTASDKPASPSGDATAAGKPAATSGNSSDSAAAPREKGYLDLLMEGDVKGMAGKAFGDVSGNIMGEDSSAFKKYGTMAGIAAALFGIFKFFSNMFGKEDQKPSEGGLGTSAKLALGAAAIGGVLMLYNHFKPDAAATNKADHVAAASQELNHDMV